MINKKNNLGKYLLFFPIFLIFIFFMPFLFSGKLPIPSDTIVGLYHPFRDLYSATNPNGIPFKNSLITDPVRQIIPWKNLSIKLLSRGDIPLWNPYEMAGKPLLANFQSSVFFPLNILLFAQPFSIGWSIFICLQQILLAISLILYLKNLKLDNRAIVLGTLGFCFSGFVISWLEWGTIVYVMVFLPLILLSIDKLIVLQQSETKIKINKKNNLWTLLYVFSFISAFFAGHLQVFFYVGVFSFLYFCSRWVQFGKKLPILILYGLVNLLFIGVTSFQWISTLQFIVFSAREVDQIPTHTPGWFIPFQNLIQFIAPDFFGNPTTLNYWGIWNYAEFVGYIGIIPLIFSFFAVFYRKDKKTLFYAVITLLCFIFALPSLVSQLPYIFSVPLISTSQPTRLLSLICFSLSVLAALGFDYFIKVAKESYKNALKNSMKVVLSFTFIILCLWIFSFFGNIFSIQKADLDVARRNLIYPTVIFITGGIILFVYLQVKSKSLKQILLILIILVTAFDLIRFANKFEPFTSPKYFFPNSKIISFLKKQKEVYRIASTDSRILPPNFQTYYKIQSIEGYDPLYLRSYGEFIAAMERGKPDIKPPFGFNRIITPRKIDSELINYLNVTYILSFSNLGKDKYEKILQEGETILYRNKKVYPRAFFVKKTIFLQKKKDLIEKTFSSDLKSVAIVDKIDSQKGISNLSIGRVSIQLYTENKIVIKTENTGDGYLVMSDVYYPFWKAFIDGKSVQIYKTNYAFRGIFVPKGNHSIQFKAALL